jgi:hypothetical protein
MKRFTPAATAASMAVFCWGTARVPTTDTTASWFAKAAFSASNEA